MHFWILGYKLYWEIEYLKLSNLHCHFVLSVNFPQIFFTKSMHVSRSEELLLKSIEFSTEVRELDKVSLHLHLLKLLTHLNSSLYDLYIWQDY